MTSQWASIYHPSPTDLVLVEGVTVAEVPDQSDEVGFEADGGGGGVSSSRGGEGGEVVGGAEDILTGFTQSMNLL